MDHFQNHFQVPEISFPEDVITIPPEEIFEDGAASAEIFPFAGRARALRHEMQGALQAKVSPEKRRGTARHGEISVFHTGNKDEMGKKKQGHVKFLG